MVLIVTQLMEPVYALLVLLENIVKAEFVQRNTLGQNVIKFVSASKTIQNSVILGLVVVNVNLVGQGITAAALVHRLHMDKTVNKTANVSMVLSVTLSMELAFANLVTLEKIVKKNALLVNMVEIVLIIALVKMVPVVLIHQAIVFVLQAGLVLAVIFLVILACMVCNVKTNVNVKMELLVTLLQELALALLDTQENIVNRSANIVHMDWIVLRNVIVIGIMLTVVIMLLGNAIVTRDGMVLDVTANVTEASGVQNVATFVIARIILPVILSMAYACVKEAGVARTVIKYARQDILVTIVQKLAQFVLTAMVPVTMLLVVVTAILDLQV